MTTLLVIALVACAAPNSSSPGPTAADSFAASPTPIPSEGSPASLQPAAQDRVVLRLDRLDASSWVPHVSLYEDGRLLRLDPLNDALTVQTMSSSGIDALLTEVKSTGSFEASHNVPLEPIPGVEVPGIDPSADRFTLAEAGAEPVVVVNTPFHDPLHFQGSAEREVLIALADRVTDTSWLPADAWVDETMHPFVPDAYLLFSGVTPMPGICASGSGTQGCQQDVSTIELPFELPPDGIGSAFTSADGTQSVIDHCTIVAPQDADALALALWPQFGTPAGHLMLSASIPWREQGATYDLTIRPLFPEEAATCTGKSLPPTIGP